MKHLVYRLATTRSEESEMTATTTSPIARAMTGQWNASQDYADLRQEACRLARRILAELDSDTEPERVDWSHTGSMEYTRDLLRGINDQMFSEGEYAE